MDTAAAAAAAAAAGCGPTHPRHDNTDKLRKLTRNFSALRHSCLRAGLPPEHIAALCSSAPTPPRSGPTPAGAGPTLTEAGPTLTDAGPTLTGDGPTPTDAGPTFTGFYNNNNDDDYGKACEPARGRRHAARGRWLLLLVPVLCATTLCYYCDDQFSRLESHVDNLLFYSQCLLDNSALLQEITRPIADCRICDGVTDVAVVGNVTRDEFLRSYAYSGRPVVVRGAAVGWSAVRTFNYTFFRRLYTQTPGALRSVAEECQFLPFNVDVGTLADVFEKFDDESQYPQEGWYFGWSNCHPKIAEQLRKHYSRPYFLPEDSESSNIDWIVMGGAGLGASTHIDFVERPSWQAQLRGTKRWSLIPPPECEHRCTTLHTIVHAGDIICVDTNQWYHKTSIEPGEMSITIGSEYD